MTIGMNDDNVVSIAQLREFLKLSKGAKFTSSNRKEAYEWIGKTLGKFRYFRESKKNRGVIKEYIRTLTGYSDSQLDRLIVRKRTTGWVFEKERTQPVFWRRYLPEDIALLVLLDNAEGQRTGGALKKTLFDMFHLYRDDRFARLSGISISHIYNLRETRQYQSHSLTYTKTQAVSIPIGERRKPEHGGKPGYLRVDSVHQGDLDKEKGVYHINLVDEVTQGEIVATVEGISEYFLLPALAAALDQFVFVILNFHSDNGSEYINKTVARLLQKMLIEQTKSRSRHSNDNALAESKNGAVVRKHFGYVHIPKKYAKLMDEFNRKYLNPYLNSHRQCAFGEETIDERGKIKKIYKMYQTPIEKLLSLKDVERYLKPGVTLKSLREKIMEKTHLAAAQEMQEAKDQLFAKIHRHMVQ